MMDVIKKNNKKNNKQIVHLILSYLKKEKHIVKLHFSETVFTLLSLYLPSEFIKAVL